MVKVLIIGGTGGLASHFKYKLKKYNYKVSITSRSGSDKETDTFRYDPLEKNISAELSNHLLSVEHILFNIGNGKKLSNKDFNSKDWDVSMRINFQYVIDFLDLIENSDFGKIKTITFISSIAALIDVGAPIAYRISKNAINSLTSILAKKWAPDIRVNTICPGNILHETSVWKKKLADEPHKTKIMIRNTVPMKNFVSPEELLNTFLFVINPNNLSVTGNLFNIDGGQTLN